MIISLSQNPHRSSEEENFLQAKEYDESWKADKVRLVDDPLTLEQQLKIKQFFDYFLLSHTLEDVFDYYGEPKGKGYVYQSLLYYRDIKPLFNGTANEEQLKQIKQKLWASKINYLSANQREREFSIFKEAIHNPASQATEFGIDGNDFPQVFATREYIRSLFKTSQRFYQNLREVHVIYRKKMTGHKGGKGVPISEKNKLLMLNDPIQQSSLNLFSPILDVLFSHMHFQTPQNKQTIICTIAGKEIKNETRYYGPTREETKEIIKKIFSQLIQQPYLNPVLQVLAILTLKEKCQFFFSSNSMHTGNLGTFYVNKGDAFASASGFYNNFHSIFCSSLINPYDQKIETTNIGTFIHESLHMVFNLLVKNKSSPVVAGSENEKKLDKALEKDRIHRKTLNFSQLSEKEKSVWSTLVNLLELEENYFPRGFDPSKASDLHMMRMEAIVRPLEQLAQGVPISALENVCPHLWQFYQDYCFPLFEEYVANHQDLIPEQKKNMIQDQALITTEQLSPLSAQMIEEKQETDIGRDQAFMIAQKEEANPLTIQVIKEKQETDIGRDQAFMIAQKEEANPLTIQVIKENQETEIVKHEEISTIKKTSLVLEEKQKIMSKNISLTQKTASKNLSFFKRLTSKFHELLKRIRTATAHVFATNLSFEFSCPLG